MIQDDTCRLLSECDAGIQMAVSALDEVLPAVENTHLRREITNSLRTHQQFQDRAKALLQQRQLPEKSPNPMAKGMNWLKTNVMLAVKPGDHSVAGLVIDGCNMGVKSLHRYCNRYPDAGPEAQELVDQVIQEEERLTKGIQSYL